MRTKKNPFFFIDLCIVITCICFLPSPVLSETLKCKSESEMSERIFDEFTSGYFIGVNTRKGVANCDNGETAHLQSFATWHVIYKRESFLLDPKEGFSQGYVIFIFKDNSKIITKFNYRQIPDPKGEAEWVWDTNLEIIKGTLRFEGIKGNISLKGKQLRHTDKAVSEWIITYTLPPK